MRRLVAHLLQGVEDAEALQQVQRRANQAFQVWLVTGQQLLEQLLLVHEAQWFFDTTVADQWQARVGRMHQRRTNGLRGLRQVDGVDLGPHGHQRLDRTFGKVQHTADHHPLAPIEQHMLLATFDQVGNFLTNLVRLDTPPAQQA
ncbi:hypothetical protein D3C80_1331050 [compost metagenome]